MRPKARIEMKLLVIKRLFIFYFIDLLPRISCENRRNDHAVMPPGRRASVFDSDKHDAHTKLHPIN